MESWVTLATNDQYAVGALVLAASLKRVKTQRSTHVIITDEVTQSMRAQLAASFTSVSVVDLLESGDECNLRLIDRPDLGCTFTKLEAWKLTQYTKCVFLDADTLVVAPSDELFGRPDFSAAPDIGWPDYFNSGVFVYVPNKETHAALVKLAMDVGSFDGGDQGVLNAYYSEWRTWDATHRLPFSFNMASSVAYSYKAAYKNELSNVRIIHFLGAVKPWHVQTGLSGVQHSFDHVAKWMSVYKEDVRPVIGGAFGNLVNAASSSSTYNTGALPDELRRQREWESGNVDYLGKDSWENIQKKLDESLEK